MRPRAHAICAQATVRVIVAVVKHPLLLVTVLLAAAAQGCEKPKPADTTPEVAEAYSALLGSLNQEAPGGSLARLQQFARRNARFRISTDETRERHQYLVVDYWLPCPDGSAECGDYNEVRTTVYRASPTSGWEELYSFVDGGSRPFVDVDGDGFPEVVGSTEYKGYVLRRIFPKLQIVVTSHSGV